MYSSASKTTVENISICRQPPRCSSPLLFLRYYIYTYARGRAAGAAWNLATIARDDYLSRRFSETSRASFFSLPLSGEEKDTQCGFEAASGPIRWNCRCAVRGGSRRSILSRVRFFASLVIYIRRFPRSGILFRFHFSRASCVCVYI